MVGVYIVAQCLILFLSVLSLGMLGRAILSWFSMGEPTKLGSFLYVLTEPIILPLRALCDRFGWFRGVPFDMPFLMTTLLLSLVTMLLQAWIGL